VDMWPEHSAVNSIGDAAFFLGIVFLLAHHGCLSCAHMHVVDKARKITSLLVSVCA